MRNLSCFFQSKKFPFFRKEIFLEKKKTLSLTILGNENRFHISESRNEQLIRFNYEKKKFKEKKRVLLFFLRKVRKFKENSTEKRKSYFLCENTQLWRPLQLALHDDVIIRHASLYHSSYLGRICVSNWFVAHRDTFCRRRQKPIEVSRKFLLE